MKTVIVQGKKKQTLAQDLKDGDVFTAYNNKDDPYCYVYVVMNHQQGRLALDHTEEFARNLVYCFSLYAGGVYHSNKEAPVVRLKPFAADALEFIVDE